MSSYTFPDVSHDNTRYIIYIYYIFSGYGPKLFTSPFLDHNILLNALV